MCATAIAVASVTAQAQRNGQRGGGPAGGGPPGPATVEFTAVTADGQLVADLAANQVTLKVDNKDRTIASLELVRFTAPAAATMPPAFGSNALTDAGRTYLLIVDEESLRPAAEAAVKEALTTFASTVHANDRLSLFTMPRGTQSLAPTTDRAPFTAAVAAIQSRAKATMTTQERRCHARDLLTGVGSVMGGLGATTSATPVVLFSTAISGVSESSGSADDCVLQTSDFQRVAAAADQVKAQFYIVRPEEPSSRTVAEGIDNLAGVTGGTAIYLTGADGAMARVARETSAYYVATFTAEGEERTGMSRRLELKSTRADVTIKARPTLAIARGSREAVTPQSMLRELTVHRDFGLRAVGIASRNDGDPKNPMKVVALAEPTDPSVKFKAAAAALYDGTGKLLAQWTARPEELQRSPMVAALPIVEGNFRLRVAAVDTNNRAATADYEVKVAQAPAGPAKLGGLMVGKSGTKVFEHLILLGGSDDVLAVFELYGRPEVPFRAVVEIADSTGVKTIAELAPQVLQTQIADKFLFMATLPTGQLQAGDYLVRAKVTFENSPTGELRQTIRKQ